MPMPDTLYRGMSADGYVEVDGADERQSNGGYSLVALVHTTNTQRCRSCWTARLRNIALVHQHSTDHTLAYCLSCAGIKVGREFVEAVALELARKMRTERREVRSVSADWATRAMEMTYGRYTPEAETAVPVATTEPNPHDPASWDQATNIRNGVYEVRYAARTVSLRIWTLTRSANAQLVGKRVIGRLYNNTYQPFAFLTVGGQVKMWRRYEDDDSYEDVERYANILVGVLGTSDRHDPWNRSPLPQDNPYYSDQGVEVTRNHLCRQCNQGLDRYYTESRLQGLCTTHATRTETAEPVFTISNPLEVPAVMVARLHRSEIHPELIR